MKLEVVEGREPSYTVDRNVNWSSLYEEQYGGSLKSKNSYHMILHSNSWACILRKLLFKKMHASQC